MKVSPAQLFPVLRSDAQGMVLAKLFMRPEEGFGITQLASFAGVSVPTAMREVDRLMEAQLVNQKTFGRARVIQVVRTHALFDPIRKIVAFSYGPAAVLPSAFSGLDGLEHAYIYGAWAARLKRQRGPEPKDIDVLLVGYMNRIEAARAVSSAEALLDRGINVQFVSATEWERGESDFVRTIKANPLVELALRP